MIYLKRRGISTGVHYPVPLHKQPCMLEDVYLPVTERCVEEILSLPMHPQLSREEVEYVCDNIKEAL